MQRQYATFYLGDSLFGIDILLVREINRNLEITPVDRAPEIIAGLLNLRGQIVTVIDMHKRMGSGAPVWTGNERCIVLKTTRELEDLRRAGLIGTDTSRDQVGLLVDRIGDMVTVDDNQIEQPPSNVCEAQSQLINGVVRLEKELLILIKIEDVLNP